jgi:hypothetical protein
MVARGLLRVENGPILTSKLGADEIAEKRIALLRAEPSRGYHWRETYDWAKRLASGKGDERGRRILTDAGFANAKYVAKVAHRAALGHELPTEQQFLYLRGSIERLHEELRAGAS